MQSRRFVVLVAATLAVGRFTPAAEESSTTVTNQSPPVVVTATRLPGEEVPLANFPANVSVIDRAQIDASPAFTLPELLRQQVGVVPFDTVGFGQFGSVMMRGYGERTGTLILVDGVRVNDAGDSTLPFLWNTIPLNNIERVEVIRGGASTTYGEGAIGGVINIITRKPAEEFQLNAQGAGGNLGYYSGHLDVSGREGWFDYYVGGDRQEWNGWRDSSAYRGWSLVAKPAIETEVGRFAFGYYFHDETVENPGILTRAEFQANPQQAGANTFVFDNELHRGTLDYSKTFDTGWTVLGKVFGQEFDTASASAFGTGAIEQPNYGGTVQTSHTAEVFDMPNTLTVGGELIQQDFQSDFFSSFGTFTTSADNWTGSLFAQDTLQVFEQLALTLGGRYDHREWDVRVMDPFNPTIDQSKRSDVWSYKATALWEPVEQTATWISASRSFRLPTGFDISAAGSSPGTLFFANPDIDPVDARTLEVGARCDRSRYLAGSVAWFYSEVKDDILFNPLNFQNENFDSTRQGVELALTSMPAEWADFYFTTTFIDARFDGGAFDDNRLPLVPEWQLTSGVNVRPLEGLQLTLESVYITGQVRNNDVNNDFSRNQYVIVNAKARYQWKEIAVFVAVNNLLDRLYETFPTTTAGAPQSRAFNPAPGLSVQAGASVTF